MIRPPRGLRYGGALTRSDPRHRLGRLRGRLRDTVAAVRRRMPLDSARPEPRIEPEGRVVCVLFNTLAHESRFWGNMQLSLVSGDMKRMGIDNDLIVLLMRPGEADRNLETVEEFVALMRRWAPSDILLWANWLPWLPDRLRRETGARVMTLDPANPGDVADELREMDPHASAVATIAGARTPREAARVLESSDPIAQFTPNFDYQFVGSAEPVDQTLAFVSLLACPFNPPIADNPCYDGVDLPEGTSDRGCAYCNAARRGEPMGDDEKQRQLAHQIRYLQRHLPALEEIAVPFPEDYLAPLERVLRDAPALGIEPITLSGQFNSDSLVSSGGRLGALLDTAARRGFEFHVNVVGLESFCDEDLQLYNRGNAAVVEGALQILRDLRKEHAPATFMPATVASLILFHPWQTLARLRESLDGLVGQGVEQMFETVNLNDVRFHPGVPLYHLARRDGLLGPVDTVEVQDVPLGGYFAEEPWRFAHDDTAAVHALYTRLHMGTAQRISLLEACVRSVEQDEQAEPERVWTGLDRLATRVSVGVTPGTVPHRILRVGASSNVRHERDLWRGWRFTEALTEALAEARGMEHLHDGRVTVAGPEPTLLPWLPDLVARLAGWGAHVELLTHGRMLTYPRYAARLLAAGVGQVSVLLHSHRAGVHDEAVHVPGAFRQATAGLAQLARLGHASGTRTGIVAVLGPENRGELHGMVDLAVRLGATELRLAAPLANLDLGHLDATVAEADEVLAAARAAGLAAGYDPHLSLSWVGGDEPGA